jgi:hypothetical protein
VDTREVVIMAVHVDEVHTDVVAAGANAAPSAEPAAPDRLGAAEERWQEARSLVERLANRVRAEAFHD